MLSALPALLKSSLDCLSPTSPSPKTQPRSPLWESLTSSPPCVATSPSHITPTFNTFSVTSRTSHLLSSWTSYLERRNFSAMHCEIPMPACLFTAWKASAAARPLSARFLSPSMDTPLSGLSSMSSRRDDLQSPTSGSYSSFVSMQTSYNDHERTQGHYATHIIPYHTMHPRTRTPIQQGGTATMNLSPPVFMKWWRPKGHGIRATCNGWQPNDFLFFLLVGHTDRHEVSFEHRNDNCFWTSDNYPVHVSSTLYPSRVYLCHRRFTAHATMLRSYAAIAITYS